MQNLRELNIQSAKVYLQGIVQKEYANIENLVSNSVGIGEHGDVVDEIDKRLDEMAAAHDKLEILNKYWPAPQQPQPEQPAEKSE